MSSSDKTWLPAAVVVALVYVAVGLGFGALAGAAGTPRARFTWRLAAFIVSGVAFLAQLAWEHFRLRQRARETAGHAAAAVALGALALAAAANLHPHDPTLTARLRLSLVLWPLVAALPAAAVAWLISGGLGRVRR